jgi:uncharacterized membrane protein YwzB
MKGFLTGTVSKRKKRYYVLLKMYFCLDSVAVEKYSTNGFVSVGQLFRLISNLVRGRLLVVKIIIKSLKFWALHSFEYDDTTLYLFSFRDCSERRNSKQFQTIIIINN